MSEYQHVEQLVMPRLKSAVDSFVALHGTRPTKVIVPFENWLGSQQQPRFLVDHYNQIAEEVLPGLTLIPVPHQLYIAVDDHGRYFDYGNGLGGGPGAQRI